MAENTDKIGALWEREGKYGTFWSGNIEVDGRTIKIVVNRNKPEWVAEKQGRPTHQIKLDTWEPGQSRNVPDPEITRLDRKFSAPPPLPSRLGSTESTAERVKEMFSKPPAPPKREPTLDGFTDDIPF